MQISDPLADGNGFSAKVRLDGLNRGSDHWRDHGAGSGAFFVGCRLNGVRLSIFSCHVEDILWPLDGQFELIF